ncbi:MAG: hypothetical protein IKS52_12765 [Clostridia bacterium]|nr:hypothetical protein [Clostridia bacterium]MBR4444126.1 hypothetical protein [Clostridia bacterium]
MKPKTPDLLRQPKWRLLVFRRAMTHVSAALVICALIAGLYRSRAHFMFACCAAGTLLLAGGWITYCRWRDGRLPEERAAGAPYILRRDKRRRPHRPAFLMDSADFDDDLTPFTTAAEEDFPIEALVRARIAAQALAGAVMLAVSALA